MAEFQKVMQQWSRMCKTHDCCASCDIYVNCGAKYPESRTDFNIKTIESTVMDWAKSHPEPVYPTWFEYVWNQVANRGVMSDHDLVTWMSNIRIPEDIAQKLGLEPKEK